MILFLQQILLLQNNKTDLLDNTFYLFKTKSNLGSLIISNTTKQTVNRNGKYELFNLEYSEYIKNRI
jgi:proteasome assembly chaperone (PAC2) family protein